MAVPFYVPDTDEHQRNSGNGGSGTSNGGGGGGFVGTGGNLSQPQTTTTSATQTPLQSPVSGEHLVQAFYEALYRYSNSIANGSPMFPSPPQSPSCSSASSVGYFVFPCANNSSPISSRLYIDSGGRYSWDSPRGSISISRRRLNSTGEEIEDDEDVDCPVDEDLLFRDDFQEHFNSIAAREQLEMFPGRIPPKKKSGSRNHVDSADAVRHSDAKLEKSKGKDPKFVWPTVVTAVVLAVGCGFLVTR